VAWASELRGMCVWVLPFGLFIAERYSVGTWDHFSVAVEGNPHSAAQGAKCRRRSWGVVYWSEGMGRFGEFCGPTQSSSGGFYVLTTLGFLQSICSECSNVGCPVSVPHGAGRTSNSRPGTLSGSLPHDNAPGTQLTVKPKMKPNKGIDQLASCLSQTLSILAAHLLLHIPIHTGDEDAGCVELRGYRNACLPGAIGRARQQLIQFRMKIQ